MGQGLVNEAPASAWDAHVHVFDAARPVAPGHYQPVHRPLEAIEALAQAHGVGHLVLVQPSVYACDNEVLLQALAREPGRHRAVVVVDAGVSDAELARMQALGVRGVRFNLVSPVGNGAADLLALAPRLHALGWHVQWYARSTDLPSILDWHRRTGLPCVLDHLAGLHAALAGDDPAWACLGDLLALGAWVKWSGWYRLGAEAPYTALQPALQRVATLATQAGERRGEAPRLVWGSDWPHTAFTPDALPAYDSVWQPVLQALGPQAALAVREAGARLYA
ncbi:amidohydrolase family protein [Curvibacter sp. HBC61]|uniref:Amidohydrolase family protein n=1 Tax=Curvibacter cyanobacteriorum TaxID=3026422 RepID=A0ABT5N1N6_9BURK|nr:amidohydrolase family protein [Curvibacter sp. HBC61]MDD0838943.1 amidohydrolase family protein [Curvibacter sp. HBC61]